MILSSAKKYVIVLGSLLLFFAIGLSSVQARDVTLTPDQLAGLTITFPTAGTFKISVAATGLGGIVTQTMTVTVIAMAQPPTPPTLTVQDVEGQVGEPIPLAITTTDADSITITIPDDAALSIEMVTPPPMIEEPLPTPTNINYEIIYPDDSGVVNAKTDYGARGDGVTDDTRAIRLALTEAGSHPRPVRPVFLPAGTYLVSDTVFRKNAAGDFVGDMVLYGQGEGLTTIKLRDNAPGFGDPNNPKAVVLTSSYCFKSGGPPACDGNRDQTGKGEGNEAFRNFIRDLTVDTGVGNPGAIGVDYLVNNMGSLRRVSVISGDGSGVAGVSMTRKWPGPAIVKDIHVQGFDYGVDIQHTTYSMVIEDLVVMGQNVAGIRNDRNTLSVRNMRSVNSVPAIQNLGTFSLLSVLDSHFEGGVSASSAIENEGHLFARNVTTAGYDSAIQGVSGEAVSEYTSHPTLRLFSSPGSSLGLLVKDTPMEPWEPSGAWVNVQDFGAVASKNVDNTPAIQAAIDSGASTIYFPTGMYGVKSTIHIRGSVRHIISLGSVLVAPGGHVWTDANNKRPVWLVEDGTSDTVWIHDFHFNTKWFTSAPAVGATTFVVNTVRTFVMVDTRAGSMHLSGGGDVFIDNVCCPTIEVDGGNLWIRQYNVERAGTTASLINNGGNVWVFGLKTERAQTVVEGNNGSRTEIFGGLFYPVRDVPASLPAIVNNESHLSVSFSGIAYAAGKNYTVLVKETRDGVTKTLKYADVPPRGSFSTLVPLYVGEQ